MANKNRGSSSPGYNPKPHILAFVDALGFSKEVLGTASDSVRHYFETIDHLKPKLNSLPGITHELKLTTIGDSVILAIEVDEDGKSPDVEILRKIYSLAAATSALQGGFAIHNIWTRGAITFGPLHFSESRIVGPGFHRAVYLESKVARYPRVIVDGHLISSIGNISIEGLIYAVNAVNPQRPVLYQFNHPQRLPHPSLPHDVPTFVDFGRIFPEVFDRAAFMALASGHLAGRMRGDAEHFTKYRWVADYLLICMHDLSLHREPTLDMTRRVLAEG